MIPQKKTTTGTPDIFPWTSQAFQVIIELNWDDHPKSYGQSITRYLDVYQQHIYIYNNITIN